MRVIAGKYRGRPLAGPKHKGLRPTADRVKEALFNIFGSSIVSASLLDLFAGTGSIGIEALSRGADSVVFVDNNLQSLKLLRTNLQLIDSQDSEKIRVLHFTSDNCLAYLEKEGASFNFIFLDPPFEGGLYLKTIQLIHQYRSLKEDGVLAVEHPQKVSLEEIPFMIDKSRNYGDINLTFCINVK